MTEPLYLMPWSTMFPLGISSATIGIAEGALAAHLDSTATRRRHRNRDQGRPVRHVCHR